MEVPVELLTDGVNHDRILRIGKIVDELGPDGNGEADEKDGVDQHHGKFQVRRNAGLHTFVIGDRMSDCL